MLHFGPAVPLLVPATILARVRIDAHQHFWRYSASEFGWIDDRMQRLRRDFLPEHLGPELASLGIAGTVAVQARSSLEETRFLLGLAREHPFVRGVVGWVDLCSPAVERELEQLAGEPLLKGVRHVVQDEPDERFLLRDDFQRGVARLARLDLLYDILIYPRHLQAAAQFVDRFPEQRFVLDHLAKPRIASGERAAWQRGLRELARRPQVACKLSGLVTEADWDSWRPLELFPYLDAALEAFGEERLLFGSDWPVCLLAASSYGQVAEVVLDWAERLTPAARAGLFGRNAERLYRLA